MRHVVAIAIALVLVLASATGSFHFGTADHRWPVTSERGLFIPAISKAGGLISIDYLKNTTREPGPGRLSSNWYDLQKGGQTNVTGQAEYLGFKYAPTGTVSATGELYYTGEASGGRRIYVSPDDRKKSRLPEAIYLSDNGTFARYSLVDKPPIYAYTPCGAYNVNETVSFGLSDDEAGPVELRNAAPYVIQRKEPGGWTTVFRPVAAQVIVPMDNGTFREWQWDQKLDDGSPAPYGDYRAVIADDYAVEFSLSPASPVVEKSEVDFDAPAAKAVYASPAPAVALADAYKVAAAGSEARDDLISLMQFKALAKKLSPAGLKAAIGATREGTALPCMAVYAQYDGRPAWIIVVTAPGEKGPAYVNYYVVSEGSVLSSGTGR